MATHSDRRYTKAPSPYYLLYQNKGTANKMDRILDANEPNSFVMKIG